MIFMRKLCILVFVLSFIFAERIYAQQEETGGDIGISVKMDVRFDGEVTRYGKDKGLGTDEEYDGGFVGRYLKLLVNGKIDERFSYSFRHRMYDAYNIIWYGKIAGWMNTIWSVNMLEYEKGHFINYLALGNKFLLGRVSADLDYMNRYAGKGTAFAYDRYVLPGVELGFYGAGVEYFPIKSAKQSVRLHAFWHSNTSTPVPQTFNVGLRWQMNVLER